MSFTFKLLVNCSSREISRTFKRQICKTLSATNTTNATLTQDKSECSEEVSNKWIPFNLHNNNRAPSKYQTRPILTEDNKIEFMAAFPGVVKDITDKGKNTDIPDVYKRYAKLLEYAIPSEDKTSGLVLTAAYKYLEKPELLSPANIKLANILGWCVIMMQGSFNLMDDVMDCSETRHNLVCWYKREDVGLGAINDGILVESSIYALLKQHLSQHDSYMHIFEHFHDIILKTALGQALDYSSSLDPNLDGFTMNRYNAIAKYKTSYCFFASPVTLALYLANIHDSETHQQSENLLLEMAYVYQVQDDFLDCFGDPAITGSVGTDIQEGKCSWLVTVALQKANPAQRKILDEFFGKSDPVAIEIIKNLYEELDLPNTFAKFEEESRRVIRTKVKNITRGLPHEFYYKLMEEMYKRDGNV